MYKFKGFEYVIEIQHNTTKKMQHGYFCLLCDTQIKPKDSGGTNSMDLMKAHLKSSVHKLKYMVSVLSVLEGV